MGTPNVRRWDSSAEREIMPHTPGPWAVYDRKTIISESSDSSGDIIAEIWETDDQDWDETVVAANARLIAACPLMFEYIQSRAKEGCANAAKIIANIGNV